MMGCLMKYHQNAPFSPFSIQVTLNSPSKQTHNSQFAVCHLCCRIILTTFSDLALSVDSCYLLITFQLYYDCRKSFFLHVLFLLSLRFFSDFTQAGKFIIKINFCSRILFSERLKKIYRFYTLE